MKKIIFIFVALICLASCGSSSGGDDNGNEPTPNPTPSGTVAYLSAKEFVSTEWSGKDGNNQDVTLKVNSATDMTLNYFTKTLAKNTDNFMAQTVSIAYTFDEAKGTFSGKGSDGAQYSGALTSKTTLKLKMPTCEVVMTKK
ncbi:MAG: hypothetical protein IKR94_10865 [Bacteroidales bacterium]|nr:hypothetical protein [Bacteroidales bacterium]